MSKTNFVSRSKSHYVIQTAGKSHCPKCDGILDLLCHEWAGPQRERAFWICWTCQIVTELAKGEVRREGENYGQIDKTG